MSRSRQESHSEEVRNRILGITQRVILEEGVDALSIRRVAHEMNYSAPIIYHYFRDKNHLLLCAAQEGYLKSLKTVKPLPTGLSAEEELRAAYLNFVDNALEIPNAYRSLMLNSSSELLSESAILGMNDGGNSPTFAKISELIRRGVDSGLFAPCDIDLTAKVFWASLYGSFLRIIVEPNVSAEERNALINRQMDILFKGIAAASP